MSGLVGGIFGGGGDTTQTQTQLPKWYEKAARGTLDLAQHVAQRPYKAFQGQTVAGTNPYQQQAFDWTQQNLGTAQNDIRGFMNNLGGMNGLTNYQPEQVQAGQFAGSDMSQYMNPYTQNVVDTSMQAIDRQRQMANLQGAGQAMGQGAYGGSRHGVSDALTNEAALRQGAETSANLYNQGYQQATGLRMQDIANQMQGDLANQQAGLAGAGVRLNANQLGGQLAASAGQAGQQLAAALQASGNALQQQTQQQLADRYRRWQEQRNYPEHQLDIALRALGGMGLGGAGTTTTQGPPGNPFLSALGGAGMGAQIGGPWGAGIGGAMGLLGGMF